MTYFTVRRDVRPHIRSRSEAADVGISAHRSSSEAKRTEEERCIESGCRDLQLGNGPTLSVKTQDKYFGLFKAFLHWAVDENHIDKQPGANVKVAGVMSLSGSLHARF